MKFTLKSVIPSLVVGLSCLTMQTSFANESTASNNTTYGDNPNIFRVLATKTGDKIQNTAERVGNAAERGVNKIKPKVENTWENTKTFTEDKAEIAKQKTQNGLDTAVKKVGETKDAIIGTNSTPVPIERGQLSRTSTNTPNFSQQQSNDVSLSSNQSPVIPQANVTQPSVLNNAAVNQPINSTNNTINADENSDPSSTDDDSIPR